MPDLPAFGRWLRARREALDLSPAALGERVGCTGDVIHSFEAEQLRPPATSLPALQFSLS
jgi:ribosome-binding protein aMBF1 (putative translation factor)